MNCSVKLTGPALLLQSHWSLTAPEGSHPHVPSPLPLLRPASCNYLENSQLIENTSIAEPCPIFLPGFLGLLRQLRCWATCSGDSTWTFVPLLSPASRLAAIFRPGSDYLQVPAIRPPSPQLLSNAPARNLIPSETEESIVRYDSEQFRRLEHKIKRRRVRTNDQPAQMWKSQSAAGSIRFIASVLRV
jgi:hypothetical protein